MVASRDGVRGGYTLPGADASIASQTGTGPGNHPRRRARTPIARARTKILRGARAARLRSAAHSPAPAPPRAWLGSCSEGRTHMRTILLLGAVTAVTTIFGCAAGEQPSDEGALQSRENTSDTSSALVNADFIVTGLARKCIDFGGDAYQAVGTPVFLYGCNGSTAQKLRVVEVDDGTYDVSLRTNKGFCLGVRGGTVAAGRALELQACNAASAAQRFALDGDTIFVGTQASGTVARDLVVEVDRGRGANRSPLVVGTRDLDPAEDFRFAATSFAALLPTSGFKYVMNVGDLDRALAASHWGSVIEVAPDTDIRIDDATTREIRGGVTVRSNRRGTASGSGIHRANSESGALFRIAGDNVRVTGLRLGGPSTSKADDAPKVAGVLSDTPSFRALVDHNEMSGWTDAAVSVNGSYDDAACFIGSPTAQNVRVIANYIHDNSRQDAGYGVVSGHGGNPYVDGNTFARNRHAVAADNRGQTSYTAKFNLVTESNRYCSLGIFCWKEQDFDVHGSGDGSHFQGGSAGYLFEMRSNTFFPDGKNIDIRGTPCNLVTIANNVFFNNSGGDAIKNATEIDYRVQISGSTFPPPGPQIVVGDFDGDGTQDDFIGTGAAWFYRANRTGEWRILNRYNERPAQLTFGDYDGDGRTDVRTVDARGVTQTSWGGTSSWDAPARVITVPIGPIFERLP